MLKSETSAAVHAQRIVGACPVEGAWRSARASRRRPGRRPGRGCAGGRCGTSRDRWPAPRHPGRCGRRTAARPGLRPGRRAARPGSGRGFDWPARRRRSRRCARRSRAWRPGSGRLARGGHALRRAPPRCRCVRPRSENATPAWQLVFRVLPEPGSTNRRRQHFVPRRVAGGATERRPAGRSADFVPRRVAGGASERRAAGRSAHFAPRRVAGGATERRPAGQGELVTGSPAAAA